VSQRAAGDAGIAAVRPAIAAVAAFLRSNAASASGAVARRRATAGSGYTGGVQSCGSYASAISRAAMAGVTGWLKRIATNTGASTRPPSRYHSAPSRRTVGVVNVKVYGAASLLPDAAAAAVVMRT
jgi:hypothetical protein